MIVDNEEELWQRSNRKWIQHIPFRVPQEQYWWQSAQQLELTKLPFLEVLAEASFEVILGCFSLQFPVGLLMGVQLPEEWLLLR